MIFVLFIPRCSYIGIHNAKEMKERNGKNSHLHLRPLIRESNILFCVLCWMVLCIYLYVERGSIDGRVMYNFVFIIFGTIFRFFLFLFSFFYYYFTFTVCLWSEMDHNFVIYTLFGWYHALHTHSKKIKIKNMKNLLYFSRWCIRDGCGSSFRFFFYWFSSFVYQWCTRNECRDLL